MVNKKKTTILEILKKTTQPVSGETLAMEMGISRVAAWKHIKQLKERDYPIESSSKGYFLSKETDSLSPYDFPGREEQIYHFSQLGSTMDEARDLALKGASHQTVVFADQQEGGIAQDHKSWPSPLGNLYFTQILRIPLSPLEGKQIEMALALALREAIHNTTQLDIQLQWPGSLILKGKKTGGILMDHYSRGNQLVFSNAGIGVNILSAPQRERYTCLGEHSPQKVTRKALYKAFSDSWIKWEKRITREDLQEEWNLHALKHK